MLHWKRLVQLRQLRILVGPESVDPFLKRQPVRLVLIIIVPKKLGWNRLGLDSQDHLMNIAGE